MYYGRKWTLQEIEMLWTDTDKKIASKIGVSVSAVTRKRIGLMIPRFKPQVTRRRHRRKTGQCGEAYTRRNKTVEIPDRLQLPDFGQAKSEASAAAKSGSLKLSVIHEETAESLFVRCAIIQQQYKIPISRIPSDVLQAKLESMSMKKKLITMKKKYA